MKKTLVLFVLLFSFSVFAVVREPPQCNFDKDIIAEKDKIKWLNEKIVQLQKKENIDPSKIAKLKINKSHLEDNLKRYTAKPGEKCLASFTSSNGNIYNGFFIRDVFQYGNVTLYYENGDKYKGRMDHGIKQGDGTLFKSNGDRYFGVWENDILVVGTYTQSNGTIEYFPKDEKVKSKKNNGIKYMLGDGTFKDGWGIIFYDNGSIYIGEFRKLKKHGRGRMISKFGGAIWGCYVGAYKRYVYDKDFGYDWEC